MESVYILALKNGKYYIGKSKSPFMRIDNHFNGNGSEWTKIHKPINVVKVIPECTSYDENKYTIEYMIKYGINNVRGGTFSKPNLPEHQLQTLYDMLNSCQDRCFKCGGNDHFAKECDDYIESDEVYNCEHCDGEFTFIDFCRKHESKCKQNKKGSVCYNCGKYGHYASTCYVD